MKRFESITALAAMLLCILATAAGQEIVSAKSGLVNYFEGKVLLDGAPLVYNRARFAQIPAGGTLESTDQGRAEVMLSPGVLMWVGEGSTVELVSDNLLTPSLRLVSGGIVISGNEFNDKMSLEVLVGDDTVQIKKKGIYRLDTAPPSLYVYDGEAYVTRAGVATKVGKGRTLLLADTGAKPQKFDRGETTPLLAWAESRDSQIQAASLSTARRLATGGYPGLGYGYTALGGLGYWLYNPYFGMYSFVPFSGALMSPFGYYYMSPYAVTGFYNDYLYALRSGYRPRPSAPVSIRPNRGGFPDVFEGSAGYSRGASAMDRGSVPSIRSMGSSNSGSYSRGSAAGAGSVSVPSSPGGASMGRGGTSAGRGGGGRR
ncbi:MAG: hypothetical protein LC114_24485 [Bryobacterales bacterium]|nr:hypothetical protein [Bryobacterales bacterium]